MEHTMDSLIPGQRIGHGSLMDLLARMSQKGEFVQGVVIEGGKIVLEADKRE